MNVLFVIRSNVGTCIYTHTPEGTKGEINLSSLFLIFHSPMFSRRADEHHGDEDDDGIQLPPF